MKTTFPFKYMGYMCLFPCSLGLTSHLPSPPQIRPADLEKAWWLQCWHTFWWLSNLSDEGSGRCYSQTHRIHGLFTYIIGEEWPHSRGNLGRYSLHGASGKVSMHGIPDMLFMFMVNELNICIHNLRVVVGSMKRCVTNSRVHETFMIAKGHGKLHSARHMLKTTSRDMRLHHNPKHSKIKSQKQQLAVRK